MKTKLRIQESSTNALGAKFGIMSIQILTERYRGARYLEPMGEITFQKTLGESGGWYAMHFVVNTDNAGYIDKIAKLAKFIKQNRSSHSAQPDEIIQLIGGQEHVYFDGEFVPVSDKGKSLFKVILTGNLYDRITAPNEIIAQKILDKKNIAGATLQFDKVIQF